MSTLTLDEFVDKLDEVMLVLMKAFARRSMQELCQNKLTLSQFLLLGLLHKQKECNMSHLADFMQVSLPTITGVVDRLVRQGLVLRLSDPNDRRLVKIKLTPQGQSLLQKIFQQRRKTIKELFCQVSDYDRKEYLRILNSIKERILKEG